MKKIIIVFGGIQFSEGMFQLARQLNELQPILLVGVFLSDVMYENIYSFGTGLPATYFSSLVSESDEEAIQQNMDRFATLCQRNDISYRVHKDTGTLPLPELKQETRFADLLIIGSEKFYETIPFNDPNPSIAETLHAAECPVLIVPEKFEFPKRNILTYDGSEASVFAIKQFAYLFPELCNHETLLVYASEEASFNFPDELYIEELATQHFKNLDFLKLQLEPKKHFTSWLSEQPNVILIGGSFGRSPVSELFRKSFLKEVIAEHKLPVFIAHR